MMREEKIALLGPREWALASIHNFVQKYLLPHYQVDMLFWDDPNEIQQAISGEYKLVIGESHIMDLGEKGYNTGRGVILLPMYHHNVLTTSHPNFHSERDVSKLKNHTIGAISKNVALQVKQKYKVEASLLPIGVCDKFWEKRNITQISKLGHVSDPLRCKHNLLEYETVKRSKTFFDIVKQSNIPGDHICGKHFSEGTKIYDGFDMVICTSIDEGNPMSLLECAAAKIPFISTKVGIVPEYNSVKTFDTVEEAVEIIKHLKSSPLILQQYVNDVYDEIITDREWSKVIEKYWIPEIQNILKK